MKQDHRFVQPEPWAPPSSSIMMESLSEPILSECTLQKYEMKVYHYEKYLLKKGQMENEARQLLQHFRLEVPLHD